MARRADELGNDASIVIVNPDDDVSIEALGAWIHAVESDGDWIDLPTTAAQMITEDRTTRGS